MTPYTNAYDWKAALEKFNPGDEKVYITFIPSRRQSVKAHFSRKMALSAISQWDYGVLWGWNDQLVGWEKLAQKCADEHQQICDRCGGTTTLVPMYPYHANHPTLTWPDGTKDYGAFAWVRDKKGRIADPPKLEYLCAPCRNV